MAKGNVKITKPTKQQLEKMFGTKIPHWVNGIVMNINKPKTP